MFGYSGALGSGVRNLGYRFVRHARGPRLPKRRVLCSMPQCIQFDPRRAVHFPGGSMRILSKLLVLGAALAVSTSMAYANSTRRRHAQLWSGRLWKRCYLQQQLHDVLGIARCAGYLHGQPEHLHGHRRCGEHLHRSARSRQAHCFSPRPPPTGRARFWTFS